MRGFFFFFNKEQCCSRQNNTDGQAELIPRNPSDSGRCSEWKIKHQEGSSGLSSNAAEDTFVGSWGPVFSYI